MANRILKFGFTAILAASFACAAQAPSGPPKGSTGECKDGTYTTAAKKAGACSGHGGVQAWFGKHGNKNQSGQASSRGNGRNTLGNYHGNTGKPAGEEPAAGSQGANARSGSAAANAGAINANSGSTAVVTPNDGGETTAGPAAKSGKAGANSRTGKQAPGGGPGMVWVNTQSKVYHCYGSQFYGKTREGKYMPEQEAKKMGAKPDHGKACGK